MPHALVTSRAGRDEDFVRRFDPRFWTVNFPRPAMASVVTTGVQALRVDLAWHDSGHDSDALVGLIWESRDRLSPPLIAYEERRDYAHTRLRFRWRSAGCRPLDVLNGPVLTIEGLDASGASRAWYVRLWNHAVGTPTDAVVTLDFDALDAGFLLPAEADRVWPHAIERMFVSLTSDGSAPIGWAEMSAIEATGSGAMLTIGDALVPPHDLRLATAYDDSFNQTPERLLRAALHLGYRDTLLHYVGMSHFMALPVGDGPVGEGPVLCEPARRWHADYLSRARARGYEVILSLSFELFDAYCPPDWRQRDADGAPALTGWEPPSTLLSPANDAAMGWLERAARAFVSLALAAGQPVRFQIGEPWWWTRDGRLHAHDAATATLVPDAPATVTGARTVAERAALDRLGAILSDATARIAAAVREAAGGSAELLLLVYLPTVLDPDAPDLQRANVPVGWASPAFDVLQLEDYDWVTEDRPERSRAGLAAMAARLGYPPARTHFLSGFVLKPEDAAVQWPLIEAAAEAARAHVAERFVWALPQVARDGFVHFELSGDDPMQVFDDVRLPLAIGVHATVTTEHAVSVVTTASGYESRNADWEGARLHFDIGPGVRSEADVAALTAFFRARRGPARAFRVADPFDASSASAPGRAASAIDQALGVGDGRRTRFPLVKHYGEGAERRITRPVAGSVAVAIDGVTVGGWSLEPGGEVLFAAPPRAGATVTAGFAFDVPVRFASDRLEVARATVLAGEIASVPLVEVREG